MNGVSCDVMGVTIRDSDIPNQLTTFEAESRDSKVFAACVPSCSSPLRMQRYIRIVMRVYHSIRTNHFLL